MKYVSREQFDREVPPEPAELNVSGEHHGDLTVERNTGIKGIVEGDVHVRSGSQAHITGITRGRLVIEPKAAAFLIGVVEGDVRIDGDARSSGSCTGR